MAFVVADDQSNPQVTVQLARGLIAKHVPLILGPTGPDTCGAVTPLVAQDGPLLYCFAPTGQAQPGSYVFLTLFSGEAAPTKAALATLTSSLAAAGAKPDQIEISAWDPASLVVDALRKLGPDATAAQLRAYLVNLKGWVGANGPYDFAAIPQRGLGEDSIVVVRWDTDRGGASAVSRFGGAPLPGK